MQRSLVHRMMQRSFQTRSYATAHHTGKLELLPVLSASTPLVSARCYAKVEQNAVSITKAILSGFLQKPGKIGYRSACTPVLPSSLLIRRWRVHTVQERIRLVFTWQCSF